MVHTSHILHAAEIVGAFLVAHHFWPKGITYGDKEDWEKKHHGKKSKSGNKSSNSPPSGEKSRRGEGRRGSRYEDDGRRASRYDEEDMRRGRSRYEEDDRRQAPGRSGIRYAEGRSYADEYVRRGSRHEVRDDEGGFVYEEVPSRRSSRRGGGSRREKERERDYY